MQTTSLTATQYIPEGLRILIPKTSSRWYFLCTEENSTLLAILSGCNISFVQYHSERKKESNREITLKMCNNVVDVLTCGDNADIVVLTSDNTCQIVNNSFWEKYDVDSNTSPVFPPSQQVTKKKCDVSCLGKFSTLNSPSTLYTCNNSVGLCFVHHNLWKMIYYEIIPDRKSSNLIVKERGSVYLPIKAQNDDSTCPVSSFQVLSLKDSIFSKKLSSNIVCVGLRDGRVTWWPQHFIKGKPVPIKLLCQLHQPVAATCLSSTDSIQSSLYLFGQDGQITTVSVLDDKLHFQNNFVFTTIESKISVTKNGILTTDGTSLWLHKEVDKKIESRQLPIGGITGFDVNDAGIFSVTEFNYVYYIPINSLDSIIKTQEMPSSKMLLKNIVNDMLKALEKLASTKTILDNQSHIIKNIGIAMLVILAEDVDITNWFKVEVKANNILESNHKQKILIQVHNNSPFDLCSGFWCLKVTASCKASESLIMTHCLNTDLKKGNMCNIWFKVSVSTKNLPLTLNCELLFCIPSNLKVSEEKDDFTNSICEIRSISTIEMDVLHFLDIHPSHASTLFVQDTSIDESSIISSMIWKQAQESSGWNLFKQFHNEVTLPEIRSYEGMLTIQNCDIPKEDLLCRILKNSLHRELDHGNLIGQKPSKVYAKFVQVPVVFELKEDDKLIITCGVLDLYLLVKKAVRKQIEYILSGTEHKNVDLPKNLPFQIQKLKLTLNKFLSLNVSDNSDQLDMVYDELRAITTELPITADMGKL